MADFAASAAVNVVYHIYTAKERLDKLEDIIDGLPNFRGTISGLEELLNDIDQVYVRALTLASINGGSLHRQLDRSLEDCRRSCEEINLILISILETRTTLLKKQKYASKEPKLLGLRKDLEESKSTLGLTMRTISEARSQRRDSGEDLSRTKPSRRPPARPFGSENHTAGYAGDFGGYSDQVVRR